MNELFQAIIDGTVTEVVEAATSYYSEAKGLSVFQSFYIYPDDSIVCLNRCDGSSWVTDVSRRDDVWTFQGLYPQYFAA